MLVTAEQACRWSVQRHLLFEDSSILIQTEVFWGLTSPGKTEGLHSDMLRYPPRLAIKLKTKFSRVNLSHFIPGFANCRFNELFPQTSPEPSAGTEKGHSCALCNCCHCQDFAASKLHFAGGWNTEGDKGCKTNLFSHGDSGLHLWDATN